MEPRENPECQDQRKRIRVEFESMDITDPRPDPIRSSHPVGMAPRDLHHLREVVECGDVESASCESDGSQTRAATNLEDSGSPRQPDVVDPVEC